MKAFLVKNIPNAITLGNLLCGCLALNFVQQQHYQMVALLVFTAGVLDFVDGLAARLLKVSNLIGKDLDSLADVVTFGVVPGALWHHLLLPLSGNSFWLPYIAYAIPLASAVRLAIFNNDAQQKTYFIGLPTPANAFLLTFLPLSATHPLLGQILQPVVSDIRLAVITILIFASLLNAPIPLLSLKMTSFSWQQNKLQLVLAATALSLMAFFSYFAIPLVIVAYILLSILFFRPK